MKKTLTTLIILGICSPAVGSPLPCLMQPDEIIELGVSVSGVLARLDVDRGDSVKKGQLIATLNADVERRSVQLANERLRDQTELKSAEAAKLHADRERSRAQKMYENKLVSRQFVDKAVTEASIAEYRHQQARSRLKQASLELKVADARLKQKHIMSPIDGIITERYVATGQRIQDTPLVRIVKTSALRVEVIVPAERFGEFKIGDSFTVKPELNGLASREATISILDRTIDSASNSFRMTLAMDNTDGKLPAGARCTIDLDHGTSQ